MSLGHCAEMVEQGDPERFALLAGTTEAVRERLLPLYALNLEFARAAWASKEPMVAEMRIQWWVDCLEDLLEGKPARVHPALDAAAFLHEDHEALTVLQAIAEARRWDVWREPFSSAACLWHHLNATGGALVWLCARALGEEQEGIIRQYGQAVALAAWLRAVPDMVGRGLQPLPSDEDAAIAALAREGLAHLAAARGQRARVSAQALPALLPGFEAEAILEQAAANPALVREGGLGQSEFRRRGRLAWVALSGRW